MSTSCPNMSICDICRNIPFNRLPSEEQPALPHRPSIQDLVTSAAECQLCLLILLSIGDLCMAIKNDREGDRSADPGNWMTFSPNVKLPSGKLCMLQIENGNFMRDAGRMAAGAGPDYNGPMYFNPLEMFPERDVSKQSLRPWLFGNWWQSEDPNGPLQLIGIGVRLSRTANIEDGEGNTSESVRLRGSLIRVRSENDSKLAGIIPGRIRTTTSASRAAFSRFEHWLQQCDTGHDCAPPNGVPLPTRVLDVSTSETSRRITLVEPQGLIGSYTTQPYVALSHCWGRSHRAVTEKDNLEAHKRGIDITSLPLTFQQAVLITRRLKVRYLWIDSLCIVQGDPQDWEREVVKMGEVYANSYLTIAADSSTDDSSGCFTTFAERKNLPYTSMDSRSLGRLCFANAAVLDSSPCLASARTFASMQNVAIVSYPDPTSWLFFSKEWMPSSLSPGFERDHPRAYKIGQFGHTFDPIEEENLSQRGWTLQERLLAPRTLHFTAGQIFWECQKCLLAEDGSIFPRTFPSLTSINSTRMSATEASLRELEVDVTHQPNDSSQPTWLSKSPRVPYSEKFGYFGNVWLDLVERYSARKLTYEKDKLPALSGLARLLASSFNDVYHAGIWRSHILMGLHWQVYIYQPHHWCDDPAHDHEIAKVTPPSRVFAKEPEVYRSPSWSWASIDGTIEFKNLNVNELVAEFVECFTPPAGRDEFGQVEQGGFIKLRAPIVSLRQGKKGKKPSEANYTPFTVPIEPAYHQGHLYDNGGAHFDRDPVFPCDALFLDNEHALLLKLNQDGTYTRIGVAWIYNHNSSHLGVREVVIV